MERGVRITCGGDAHVSSDTGKFDKVYRLPEKSGMPEELVAGTSVGKSEEYPAERKQRIGKGNI